MNIVLSRLILMALLICASVQAENDSSVLPDIPLYLLLIQDQELDTKEVEKVRKELETKKPVLVQKQLQLTPFHQRPDKPPVENLSLCGVCHSSLPHVNNIRSRSFNNMHSRYIACETCHLDKKKISEQHFNVSEGLSYRWYDFFNDREASQFDTLDRHIKPLDSRIKITPFYEQKLAIVTAKQALYKQLKDHWDNESVEKKAQDKVRVHLYLKEQGEQCNQCHKQDNSLLDFIALGSSKTTLPTFTNNAIANFFSRYKNASANDKQDEQTPDEIQRIRIIELLN